MRMRVGRPRRFASFLLALLLVSVGVPCGLLEATLGGAPLCSAVEDGAEEGGDARPAQDDLDCCAACLACCASFLDAAAPGLAARGVFASAPATSPEDSPGGSRHPVWHPPRA